MTFSLVFSPYFSGSLPKYYEPSWKCICHFTSVPSLHFQSISGKRKTNGQESNKEKKQRRTERLKQIKTKAKTQQPAQFIYLPVIRRHYISISSLFGFLRNEQVDVIPQHPNPPTVYMRFYITSTNFHHHHSQ